MMKELGVLIVGAGPTGLVLAHELARNGIQCRLIDQAPHRAMESRAIAIHSRTLESFELMKVVDDFLTAGQRIAAVDLYVEGGHIARNSFASLATRYPFVLGVPQDETERILDQHVAQHGVRVERNTKLVGLAPQESSVIAQFRNDELVEEVEADWLVGCDGAHSTVREQLAIPFAGSTYPEHFVLADVKVRGDLDPSTAQVWLHEDGAVAFFPLPDDRHRLIVANTPADWHEEPSLEQCQALVDERGPDGIRLTDPRWASVFRIHRREAARFREDRIFLAGDAAHIHSPVGGQGMNIGIRDAFNLAWKLRLVTEGLASPKLLDSYEAERKPVDQAVIRQTDRATRLVSLHGSISRFVRDHLISLATRLPAVQETIGEAVSGIAVNYRHSPIVEEHSVDGTGPAPAIELPMRRSRLPPGVPRCGSTSSSPSAVTPFCCWAMPPRIQLQCCRITRSGTSRYDGLPRGLNGRRQYDRSRRHGRRTVWLGPGRLPDTTGWLYRFPQPDERGIGATAALSDGAVWRFHDGRPCS
jgi:2-polyprenyl-6-methoxyphenol hydroxylase-like FAD-dependent oxidoreductase